MANPRKHSLPVAVILFLWRVITGIRTALFNLVFLFIAAVVIIALFSRDQPPLPDNAPLLIALSGVLVDQETYFSPEDQLLNPRGNQNHEILLDDLIKTIEFAGNDSRISGLLLKLDQFQGGGVSKIQEVGAAIDRFKLSGKPVLAFADSFDQQQYFLASYADEITMHPLGNLAITGFGMYRNYYKSALDKLAVEFHVFKVGQFKDFIEPYIRNDMSDASREHNSQWLNELWGIYTDHVEQRRDLSAGALNQWINHMADQLAESQGNIAAMAQELRLVDHVVSRIDRRKTLIERFGHKEDEPNELRYVSYNQYRKHAIKKNNPFEVGNVGLIVAKGTILDGTQPEGTIGGDSLSKLIRKVVDDEDIKVLVLRIDSGGGSAFASELIRQELQAVRDKGIPIVVSMGSVAASGGYWIAMAADEIWASPTTITGSIGVFGLFPTIDKSLQKLGINTDGFGTTNLSGALRVDRPMSTEAANVIQQGVEHIYDRFIELVAENRNSTPEAIDKIAQGRVWSGQAAHALGLVDQLGNLQEAIEAAATRVGLEQYNIKLIQRELSPKEAFIKELMQEASITPTLASILNQWSGMDLGALKLFVHAAGNASNGQFNAPRSTYAACLMCIAP